MTFVIKQLLSAFDLKILAESAKSLLEESPLVEGPGDVAADVAEDETDNIATIDKDTTAYVARNFAVTFDYYYKGMDSIPANDATPVAANSQVIAWVVGEKSVSDIQNALEGIFNGPLSSSDALAIAKTLHAYFKKRFTYKEASWVPFFQRFEISDNMVIDTNFVSASIANEKDEQVAVLSYCFVSYQQE